MQILEVKSDKTWNYFFVDVFGSLIIRLIFQPISSVVSLKKLCKTVNQCLIIAVINNLKIFVTLNCIHSFYAEKFSAKDKLLIFQCQVSIFLEHWKISKRSWNLFLSSFYLFWNIHLKLSCQLWLIMPTINEWLALTWSKSNLR